MSNHKTPIKLTDTKALLLFTLWSFIFQLFLSNDSPFYGLAHHWDSAWHLCKDTEIFGKFQFFG